MELSKITIKIGTAKNREKNAFRFSVFLLYGWAA